MDDFKPRDYVYNMEASFTWRALRFNVASIKIQLAENGIPTVQLTLDPANRHGSGPYPAASPSLSNVSGLYSALSGMVHDDETRMDTRLEFTAVSKADEQKLELEGWVVGSVGLGSHRGKGSVNLQLDLVHPAMLIDEKIGNVFSSMSMDPDQFSDLKADNVFDTIVEGLETLASGSNSKGEMVSIVSETGDSDDAAEEFAKFAEHMNDYMEWDGDGRGFPTKVAEGKERALREAMARNYVSSLQRVSVWDWLSHTIASQWSVSIAPSYREKKLKMRPYEPYKPHTLEVSQGDISGIEFPAVARGIRGIKLNFAKKMHEISFYDAKNKRSMLNTSIMYSEKELDGSTPFMKPPAWFTSVIFGSKGDLTFYARKALQSGALLPDSSAEGSNLPKGDEPTVTDIADSVRSTAKQYFVENYLQDSEMVLSCRLMLSGDEGAIVPGESLRVVSEDGEGVIDAYLSRTAHVIDCQRGQAYTQLGCRYARESGSPDIESIEKGVAKSYLY